MTACLKNASTLTTEQRRGYDTAMWRVLAFLAMLLTTSLGAQQVASVTAQDLTVPSERLPENCQLAPAPSITDGPNRVRGGLWGGLPLPSNPWAGTDAPLAAKIRELVEGGRRMADGPPSSRADMARQRLRLAEDIEGAYAAFYTTTGDTLVSVFAIRLTARGSSDSDTNLLENRMRIGPFVAVHSGDGGECHDRVASHLLTLAR
jgi:hypothetical protein